MLSKCANATCDEQFKFLGKGKLFLAQPDSVFKMTRDEIAASCYWLCENCCKVYRIDFVNSLAVVKPLVAEAQVEPGSETVNDAA
jgi:hypothetical protein